MNSIERMNAAALAVARHTQAVQPQAKFIGNIAQSVAPYLSAAAPFVPALAPFAAGANAAGMLLGNHGGGGALQQIAGAVGPGMAANALARGDWSVAQQIMNDAYNRQNAAKDAGESDLKKLFSQYKDPSIGMLQNPNYIPMGSLQTVSSPQIRSLFSGNMGSVPQLGASFDRYQQPMGGGQNPYLAQLQSMFGGLNFGGFNGSFADPSASAAGAPAAPPSQPATPPSGGPSRGDLPGFRQAINLPMYGAAA